jgi:flagellar basal-body rod protein FlgB
MDFATLPLFQAVKKRLGWLGQRQEVLSQNIANADTPGYRARDLKTYDFREIVRRETQQINMTVTNPNQMSGQRKRLRDFTEAESKVPYETRPDGNSVVLEEQVMKIGEAGLKHQLTTELYRKHMSLFRLALGRE